MSLGPIHYYIAGVSALAPSPARALLSGRRTDHDPVGASRAICLRYAVLLDTHLVHALSDVHHKFRDAGPFLGAALICVHLVSLQAHSLVARLSVHEIVDVLQGDFLLLRHVTLISDQENLVAWTLVGFVLQALATLYL